MVLHYRQSQKGVVGPIVQDVKDNGGTDAPIIVQAVTLVDGSGNLLNPGSGGAAQPTPVTGATATWTDRSGTIAVGGTSQQMMAANASRRGFFVQNNSSEDLWIMDGAAATAAGPSIKIASGALYECPSTGVPATAINIVGATTGSSFSAREW